MSEIQKKIAAEMVIAMKARQTERTETLKYIKAMLKNAEIDNRKPLEDGDVIGILHKLTRQRQDAMEQYQKGQRQDLVDKEKREMKVMEEFLPQAMSEAELDKLIDATAKEISASAMSDMGKLIKAVLAKTQGQVDGRLVSEKVKRRLS